MTYQSVEVNMFLSFWRCLSSVEVNVKCEEFTPACYADELLSSSTFSSSDIICFHLVQSHRKIPPTPQHVHTNSGAPLLVLPAEGVYDTRNHKTRTQALHLIRECLNHQESLLVFI